MGDAGLVSTCSVHTVQYAKRRPLSSTARKHRICLDADGGPAWGVGVCVWVGGWVICEAPLALDVLRVTLGSGLLHQYSLAQSTELQSKRERAEYDRGGGGRLVVGERRRATMSRQIETPRAAADATSRATTTLNIFRKAHSPTHSTPDQPASSNPPSDSPPRSSLSSYRNRAMNLRFMLFLRMRVAWRNPFSVAGLKLSHQPHSRALSHTHSHPHTHALSHPLTPSHTLSHSLTLSHPPTHALSHPHTISHPLTLSYTLSHSLTLSHTLTLSHILSRSHTLTLTHSHTHSLTLSHTLSLSHSHTLSLSHSLTHSHTLSGTGPTSFQTWRPWGRQPRRQTEP